MSFFDSLLDQKEDEIFALKRVFEDDPRENKINLGIGIYKTADGKSLVMTAIRHAENLISQQYPNKDYSPIEGNREFIKLSAKFILGENRIEGLRHAIFSAQAVGGTNALYLSGKLLRNSGCKSIFLSQPTWFNHKIVFEGVGLSTCSYPYMNAQTGSLDFEGITTAIKHMPPQSAILLQVSCHNPSGIDPSMAQWKELSSLIKQQQLLPIFDIAYHGLGKGLDEDVESLRLFIDDGHELIACYSFSKNFGLYGERGGLLIAISNNQHIRTIEHQLKRQIRSSNSNPPIHVAQILSILLKSPDLFMEWKNELKNMRERINETRRAFAASLNVERSQQDFTFIERHLGLFSMLPLTPQQIDWLREELGIYLLSNGRINIAALNSKNIPQVAHAIALATRVS